GVLVVGRAGPAADRAPRLRPVLRDGRVRVRHGGRPAQAAAHGWDHSRGGRDARVGAGIRRLAVALVALALGLPASALAESYPGQDLVALIADGVRGVAIHQTAERPCPELSGGTAGLHEKDFTRAIAEGL